MSNNLSLKDLSQICKGADDHACRALLNAERKSNKSLNFSLDAQLKILRIVQEESKLFFTYSSSDPDWHEYFVLTPICRKDEYPRTVDLVWQILKRFPAPKLQDYWPVKSGDRSELLIGDVTHKVDEGRNIVANYTVPNNHWLHPGAVIRKVVLVDDIIGIATYGQGTGPFKNINVSEAEGLWTATDKSIIISVATLMRK